MSDDIIEKIQFKKKHSRKNLGEPRFTRLPCNMHNEIKIKRKLKGN